MAIVDIDMLKKHLRVLHDDEDAEIMLYGAAAEGIVVEHLDRVVVAADVVLPVEGETGYDPDAINVTPTIVAAILLVTGDLYDVREPDPKLAGDAVLPRTVRMLLAPWRIWRSFNEGSS